MEKDTKPKLSPVIQKLLNVNFETHNVYRSFGDSRNSTECAKRFDELVTGYSVVWLRETQEGFIIAGKDLISEDAAKYISKHLEKVTNEELLNSLKRYTT